MSDNDNQEMIECDKCEEEFKKDDLIDDLCHTCHELDDTPTSEDCDNGCDKLAVTNICGTNLCEDCEEHYHH